MTLVASSRWDRSSVSHCLPIPISCPPGAVACAVLPTALSVSSARTAVTSDVTSTPCINLHEAIRHDRSQSHVQPTIHHRLGSSTMPKQRIHNEWFQPVQKMAYGKGSRCPCGLSRRDRTKLGL